MEEERAAYHPDVDRIVAAGDLAQRPPAPQRGVRVGRRGLHVRRVRRQEEGEEEEVPPDCGEDPEGNHRRGGGVARRISDGKNSAGTRGSRLEAAVRSPTR